MTIRVLTYWLKPAPFWPAKTSNLWVGRRTALTWQPMTYFSFRTSRNTSICDFRQTPIFVKLVFSCYCKQHKLWSYVKNDLSKIMLKNVKLSYTDVKLHLATPGLCQARNLCSNPPIIKTKTTIIDIVKPKLRIFSFRY